MSVSAAEMANRGGSRLVLPAAGLDFLKRSPVCDDSKLRKDLTLFYLNTVETLLGALRNSTLMQNQEQIAKNWSQATFTQSVRDIITQSFGNESPRFTAEVLANTDHLRSMRQRIDSDFYTEGHSDRVALLSILPMGYLLVHRDHWAEMEQKGFLTEVHFRLMPDPHPDYRPLSSFYAMRISWKTGTQHDDGKGSVPRSILETPGKLSEEAFSLIEYHPTASFALSSNAAQSLSTDKSFNDALVKLGLSPEQVTRASVLNLLHHRNFGGEYLGYPSNDILDAILPAFGFPKGVSLQGTDIPLGARVLRVSDSFDAMTSFRIYRQFVSSIAKAFYELSLGAVPHLETGKDNKDHLVHLYDPTIVKAMLLSSIQLSGYLKHMVYGSRYTRYNADGSTYTLSGIPEKLLTQEEVDKLHKLCYAYDASGYDYAELYFLFTEMAKEFGTGSEHSLNLFNGSGKR